MGIVSRLCGWTLKLPFKAKQIAYASFFAVFAFLIQLKFVEPIGYPYPYYIWLITALTFALALIGKTTGHGRGISLFEPLRGEPEKVEAATIRLQPYLPVWVYKCLILAACESFMWMGIALAARNPFILLAALVRPVAYLIGWSTWSICWRLRLVTTKGKRLGIKFLPEFVDHHTAIGEFLTGLFSGLVLCLLYPGQ